LSKVVPLYYLNQCQHILEISLLLVRSEFLRYVFDSMINVIVFDYTVYILTTGNIIACCKDFRL